MDTKEKIKEILQKNAYDANDLAKIVEILRAPGGCPWDREQTHESIRGDLIEIRATIELDPTSPDYSAGILVRYNPNVVDGKTERTELRFFNGGVLVERNQSSLLDYVNRQPSYTWDRVKTTYEITILIDRSMMEVYVDGVISFTTRIYPKYGDSDYIRVFDNNANVKFTKFTVYRMGSAYSDTVTPPYYGNMGNLGD